MKKSTIATAITLALSSTGAYAATFNFSNTTTAGVQGTDFNFTCNTSDFTAGAEFRFCDPSGNLGAGAPLNKDAISGNETWTFDVNGVFTGISGTVLTPGVNPAYTAPYPGTSADPNGGPAMDDGVPVKGILLSFLAPIAGSPAGNAYGTGQLQNVTASTFELFFPVLEAQWGGSYLTPGQASGGITFFGTYGSGAFSMWAEELIDLAEDPNGTGFGNPRWTFQWYYTGTTDLTAIPVPAAVWLFGSGLLGLAGITKRRKA